MVPLHLSIQGLYSYQDRQEVDFTRLTEAGLFGIFGAVGSGKTTILEAMSLCIYGRTERFNQRGDDRYYNMLNLKEDEANVSFTFLAGSDAKRFRADVKLRRNRKKFEDVCLDGHSYYLLDMSSGPVPVDQQTVWDAVGISYDNFKRTLVIPQGQFREFLELAPRERTDMLKELFGLHRFDKANRVAELASENKTRLTEIEGSLKQLSEATDEELKELQLKYSQLSRQLAEWTGRHAQRRAALQDAESLKSLSDSLEDTQSELNGILLASSGDAEMLERLQGYEQLRDRYSVLLRDIDAIAADIRNKQQAHDRLLSDHLQRRTEKQNAEAEMASALISMQEVEDLQPRAEELAKMAEIHGIVKDIKALREKIKKEHARVEAGQVKIREEQEAMKTRESEAESRQAVILNDEQSLTLRIFYREQERLQGVRANDDTLRTSRQQKLAEKRKELQSLQDRMPNDLRSLPSDTLTEEDVDKASATAIDRLNVSKESIRGQLTRLAIQKSLRQYADGLVEGEPCILCGATHHPTPLQAGLSVEEERDLQNDLIRIDTEETGVRKQADLLKSQLRAISQAEREREEADAALRISGQNLDSHRAGLLDLRFGPDDRNAFEAADQASSHAKDMVRMAQEAVRKHRENIDQWNHALEELRKSSNQSEKLLAGMDVRYEVAVQSIRHLDLQAYLGMALQDIQDERSGILADIEKARKRHDMAAQQNTRLERELVELGARIGQSSDFLEGLRNVERNHLTDLEVRLGADGLSAVEVRELLRWNPDIPTLRKEIDTRRQEADRVMGRVQLLVQQMAGRNYDPLRHREAQEAFTEADGHVRALTVDIGAVNQAIRVISANIETRRKLEVEHERLAVRGRDIATLQDMFKANGFVQFVSQRYLENVVALANRRFRKMVRDKFSIELSEGRDFLVRDYLNGGRTRLLKSLSGGQTFQAALCLALALSENIQHTAGADQHFFFMDEGFGSLDSENLETVFASLRSLQQERKSVGVISHVAELQQGMDIYLQVDLDPEKGTRVRESWNMAG